MSEDFVLDERIAADSAEVARLALCDLRLMNDARFPWCLLVPRRGGVREIIDLGEQDRLALLAEIARVSEALRAVTSCHKLNVAALGNVVPQLHVHVIGRFTGDAAWPRPVWGAGEAVAYETAAREALIARLKAALPG